MDTKATESDNITYIMTRACLHADIGAKTVLVIIQEHQTPRNFYNVIYSSVSYKDMPAIFMSFYLLY